MTDARPGAPRAVLTRRALVGRSLIGAVVVVGLILAIGPRGQDGPPLDPRSTAALGTRGIVEVFERLGTDVRVDRGTPETGRDAVALVITDQLADGQRDDLLAWVDAGGRLVVADPFSQLAPDLVGLTSIAFTEPSIVPDCDDPLVDGVDRVAVAGGNVFDVPAGSTGCFPRNGGSWLVRTPREAGEVIAVGGQFTLSNELLGLEDTSVLLVNLLTPPDGEGVHVIQPDDPDDGTDVLADVLPDQVGYALLQIPLAWAALVWWRARRHGRPVVERVPVRIESSETTVAVGNLLHRAGRATDAAAIMRSRLRGELTRRLGIPATDDVDAFIAVAASRTDLASDVLARLLRDPLPADDDALVAFAADSALALAGIRQRRSADPNLGSTADPTTDHRSEQQ
jgi:hypothetical protein